MARFAFPTSCLLAAAAVLMTSSPGRCADPAADFSLVANPNGVWTYGYSATFGGALTRHLTNGNSGGLQFWNTNLLSGAPRVARNSTTGTITQGTASIAPGALSIYPGPNTEYGIVRFTASTAGSYKIDGNFFGQDNTSTDVHLLKNGSAVFDGNVNGSGVNSQSPFSITTSLAANGTIDFTVGNRGNFTADATGLAANVIKTAVTINAFSITNYTGYIIAADASDGDSTTNRQRVRTEVDLTFTSVGNYRMDWALLDPSGTAVATDTQTVSGASASMILNGQLVPSSAAPLVPSILYRARINVVDLSNNSLVASQTEQTGRTYIHFTGTDSTSNPLNVVGEITSITVGQDWLLETDVANTKMPVTVNYTLYRYDDWLGTSVNKFISTNLLPSIKRNSDGVVQTSTATSNTFFSAALPSFVAGSPKTPATLTGSKVIFVDPTTILSPTNYRFEAAISTIDDPQRLLETPPVLVTRAGNTATSAAGMVYHFNGALYFGSIATHFSHLASPPSAYFGIVPNGLVFRRIAVDLNSGTLDGYAGAEYGNGSVLNVSLANDGTAYFSAGNGGGTATSVALQNHLYGPLLSPPFTGLLNGVSFLTSSVTLDTLGARGTIQATLPTGVGWTANRKTGLLDSVVAFGSGLLTQNMGPAGGTMVANFTAGNFYLCEETKPVLIETTSLTWDTATGEFLCGNGTARSIRQPLLDALASYSALYADPSMAKKRSNDHLYNSVTTATGMKVKTGMSGGGEMTGTIASGPGEIVTHFPYNSTINFGSGSIHISADLIDVGSLTSVQPLVVKYWQHCQDEFESGCGLQKTSSITFTPGTGALALTGDGGLQAVGTATVPSSLSWGWNSDGAQYAHQVVTTFPAANFLMAGTFLRGDQNALADPDGPATILLSGFDPANLATAERPLTPAYLAGLGDYAGVNFRCLAGGFNGLSHLQGSAYGNYPLTTRSKYYTRLSGVTGIHEATPAGFPATASLAGYVFDFTKYGFSFLSNSQEDARTAGDIDLPAAVDFTLPFSDLELSCIGALESVEVVGSGAVDSKTFAFWNAPFTPYTVDFVSTSACNPADGTTLVLGFSAHASHFETPFAGSLGIKSTGNFANENNASSAIPTRLILPAALEITGTTGETYTFFPAQGAYLNSALNATTGFWSLFGTLDVPFFEDMEVQLHSSCSAMDTLSPIYVMGGWPTQGWTETNLNPFEVSVFDVAHTGQPSSVTLAQYRKTTDDGTDLYLPRAQRLWLNLISFDYPMKWSNTAFNFTSRGPVQTDLLVVNTQHELTFLDAHSAEITFGVRYDGLPEISLSNLAFNALDDATGVSSAVVAAAGNTVFNALESGVSEFNNTLSDEADPLLGRALDAAVDLPLDGLISTVKAQMADGVWTATDIQNAITSYLSVPANQLGTALNKLGAPASDPLSLVKDLDSRLANIEKGIDSVINTVVVDPVAGTTANGLLKNVDVGGGQFRRAVFEATGTALVDALAPTIDPNSIQNSLNDLIAKQDPTLASVTGTLTEVRAVVSNLRLELQNGTGFGDEIRDLISAANTQISTVSNTVGAQSSALFLAAKQEDVTAAGSLDALGTDWDLAIKQMIRDEFYATKLTADLQTAVKARLYDLQGTFNSGVDSAFASLNLSIRDALSPVLSGLDNTVNGFLNGLGDKMGASKITGFAHINGDSLDELRLDADLQLNVPENLTLAGFIEIKELTSDGPESCGGGPGASTVEVEVGALDIGLAWTGLSLDTDTRADLSLKGAFDGATGLPVGFGGSFEMTAGSISFETFKITELGAAAMFSIPNGGTSENYFAAVVALDFGSYDLAGGIFFGKSCDLDPIEMIDPLAASVLPGPSFTGIYAYGEATFPIFGTGTCLFNISAKAGAGVFYGSEGPTYGGRMSLGIYGEALCAVSVGGEVDLVGAKVANTYSFAGSGRVFGEVGVSPLKVSANIHCDFLYTESSGWKVDTK